MDSVISSFLAGSKIDWKPIQEEIKAICGTIDPMIFGKKTCTALHLYGLKHKSRSKRYLGAVKSAGFFTVIIFICFLIHKSKPTMQTDVKPTIQIHIVYKLLLAVRMS